MLVHIRYATGGSPAASFPANAGRDEGNGHNSTLVAHEKLQFCPGFHASMNLYWHYLMTASAQEQSITLWVNMEQD